MGITGSDGSSERKAAFLKLLGLPPGISNSALVKYMNTGNEELIAAAVEEYLRGI